MLKRMLGIFLTCAMLCVGACAEEWTVVHEGNGNLHLYYRIAVDGAQPKSIPEALNTADEGAALNVRFEGALYDFDCTQGRNYLASPADFDLAALLGFFWPESEAASVLDAAETVPLSDGSTVTRFANAGAEIALVTEAGRVRYARDGLDWAGADAFSGGALDPYEFAGLPTADAQYASPEQALRDAQALLDCVAVGASPLIVDAFGATEYLDAQSRSVEIYSFALCCDDIPMFHHAQQHPTSETMLPAQEIKLIYDVDGLAGLSLTAFHFEPVDETAQPFDLEAAAARLRAGEGAFLFDKNPEVSLIELQYLPVQAQDGGYLCTPAWCMSTYNSALSSSWFADEVIAAYSAFDGVPL